MNNTMRVKVSELTKFLSHYKEEYIEIELLKIFCYPRIYDIESIIERINKKVIEGKSSCTKSEFSRLTKKSRMTVDDWISKGILETKGKIIDLERSLNNLKTLQKFM